MRQERSIEMLMKKMRGEAFKSELLPPAFDVVDPAPPVQDLKQPLCVGD